MNNHDETRKIQFTGKSSYIVSLPKDWVRELGLKQGDQINVARQGPSTLQITPSKSKSSILQIEDATFEVGPDDENTSIVRRLISLYFLGFRTINVNPKTGRFKPAQRAAVKDAVKKMLMGTEIISDSTGGITIQVLVNLLELSVNGAFKRMLHLAKSMLNDALLSIRESNYELAQEVINADDEVDRFGFYIIRQLKIAIQNEHMLKEMGFKNLRDCLGYRLVVKNIERTGDHAVIIAKDLLEFKKPIKKEVLVKIQEMSDHALSFLDEACLALFKEDFIEAEKLIKKTSEITKFEKKVLDSAKSIKDDEETFRVRRMVENIRRIAEYASDITEIVLNMNVEKILKKAKNVNSQIIMKSAILITYDEDDSLNEALALCDAAFYKVTHVIKQDYLQRAKFGISEKKVEDVKELKEKLRPDVIIYDEILKPSQNYNLASKLKIPILDRETLILEIFENRATSSESKLQIKLAQLRYEMSRAREKVRLAKMGEQPGFLGIGQFEVDVYFNDIKHRIVSVKSKLKKAGKQRALHRQARKRLGFKTISLAGYTSAGKTTLFNQLTGEEKQKGSELFTTLTTTTRRFNINKKPVLISDTVGFISKLPAYMIDAFKSTLEELLYTDLILFVIDVSESYSKLKMKFNSCTKTLSELGVESDKLIYVLNKSDLLDSNSVIEKSKYLKINETKKWVPVSSSTGENILQLKELIDKMLEISNPEVKRDSQKEEMDRIYGL